MLPLRLPVALPGVGTGPIGRFTQPSLTVKASVAPWLSMDLSIQTIGNATYLIGDTFAAKDIIKRHGGRWDSYRQGWKFPDDVSARACADEVEPHLAMMKELEAL